MAAEQGKDHGHPRASMWPYPVQPWPPPWPQGYTFPVLPPQPSQMPQGTAPPQDPWSVVGADPWAAAAAAAAAVAAGTGMSPFPGSGAGPAIQPPTYPAPGTANFGVQSGPNVGASTAARPDSLPSSVTPPLAAQPTFQGRGGLDASQSVTGITAEFLLTQTRKNIEAQQLRRSQSDWKTVAKDLAAQNGQKRMSRLGWEGSWAHAEELAQAPAPMAG